MKELAELCGVSQSELETAPLDQLREACVDVGAALEPSGGGIALLVGIAALGALWVLLVRLNANPKEETASVVGTTIEGAVYGSLGAYGGLVAGLLVADFLPPPVAAALFGILPVVVLVLIIIGMVKGGGGGGWKVVGLLEGLVLAGGLVVLAVAAISVPSDASADEYSQYLNTTSVGLALTGGVNGILVAVFRGAHWSLGWLLVPLNGSWGFLGNVLGLTTHIASYNAYKQHGDPDKSSERLFYVHYEKGLSLKSVPASSTWSGRFAFCQGAVLSADTDSLERHEAVHALQHYIAGPFYPLSHFAWFIPMLLIGALVGWARTDAKYDEGATAYSYYNNPWEVMAYGFINPGGRDTTKPLIFDWWLAVLFAVVWIALAAVGAVAVLVSIF